LEGKKSSLYLLTIPVFTQMNTIADEIRNQHVPVLSQVPFSLGEFARSLSQMVYEYFLRVSRTSSLQWVCYFRVKVISIYTYSSAAWEFNIVLAYIHSECTCSIVLHMQITDICWKILSALHGPLELKEN
jgi:hypothetical protein